MHQAEHAQDGRLVLQLVDLEINLKVLQAPIEVHAEQELLPEVKLVATVSAWQVRIVSA